MPEHRYILEPYKGKDTRYDCPECGKSNEFTRYIDTQTGEHLTPNVGICNRKIECGYHYPPKQYFEDNRHLLNTVQPKQHTHTKAARIIQPKPVSYVPVELFKASLKRYEENNLVKFLCSIFNDEITTGIIKKYYIGTSKHWSGGASIFWQIDNSGRVRTGKIMLYNPVTGKRVKEFYDHFYWVHKELQKPDFTPIDYFEPSFYANKPLKEYNLKQCFFGERLLNLPENKNKPVLIFESEKTAIIASVYFPDYICLACGGFDGLNPEKCKVLQGRNIVLYPDLSKPDAKVNCFEIWNDKAKKLSKQFPRIRFNVSDLLESKATEAERQQGLDLADYLIITDYRASQQPEQPKPPQPEIEQLQPISINTFKDVFIPAQTMNPLEPETKVLNITGTPDPEHWQPEIAELGNYFNTATLPTGELKLNAWSTINNVSKFINSNLTGAKNYKGNKRLCLSYLDPLRELKQYLTAQS